jgi:mannosyltransferase
MVAADRSQQLVPESVRGGRRRAGARSLWLLAGIVLIGVVVRFPTLGEQSFWYDEAITHGIVAHSLGHVLSTVPESESTPPLYYVLVWLWSRMFGTYEVGLRSFSALCGTLTIPLVWLLGRRLVSDRVGLIAALLTAVNPLLFWYSQEARSYALLVLLSALSLWVLVWALEAPSRRRLLLWGLSGAVALCAHYFAVFLVAAEALWLLFALRGAGRLTPARLAAAFGPVVVAGAALLPLAIHQNDGRAGFIADHSGSLAYRLAQLVKQDIVGFDEPLKIATSIVAVLLVVIALLLLVQLGSRRERHRVLLPLAVGTGTVLLALIVAAVGTDYVNTRNLLPSFPAFVVVVAAGLGAGRAGRTGALALLALVVISLVSVIGVITTPEFQRMDWRGAARALGTATVARAIVADHSAGGALGAYMSGLSGFPPGTAVREVDVVALVYRPAGARVSAAPPNPAVPPTLPGFTLVGRRHTESYTVLRYRAPAPVAEQPTVLAALSLIPGDPLAVLEQRPRSG